MTDTDTADTDTTAARDGDGPPRLPPEARAKFLLLQGQSQDAREASDSAHRRMGDLSRQLSYGGERPPENADATQAEIARLRGVVAQQGERHRQLASLVATISHWLRSLPPSVVLEYRKVAAPQLNPRQTAMQAIEHLREQIETARQQHRAVQSAPLPKGALRRAARTHVEQMVARGRPRVNAGRTLVVAWGDPRAATPGTTANHVADIAAWLQPEVVLRRLEAEIEAMPEPKLALTDREREDKMTELRSEIDALERKEEAVIAQVHARDGVEIMRRVDASPLAVLCVEHAHFRRGVAAR